MVEAVPPAATIAPADLPSYPIGVTVMNDDRVLYSVEQLTPIAP